MHHQLQLNALIFEKIRFFSLTSLGTMGYVSFIMFEMEIDQYNTKTAKS